MESRRSVAAIAAAITVASAGLAAATLATPAAQATSPTSAYAIIGTISLPGIPFSLAVDADDDTVYAATFIGSKLVTIPPGMTSGTASSFMTLPGWPLEVAVDSNDDSVYLREASPGTKIWVTRRGATLTKTIEIGRITRAIAVNSVDDTLYVSVGSTFDDTLIAMRGSNTDDSFGRLGIGRESNALGVDDQNDRVWAAANQAGTLKNADGASLVVQGSVSVPAATSIAVSSVTHQAFSSTGANPIGMKKADPSGLLGTFTDPRFTRAAIGLSLDSLGTRLAFISGSNDDTLWLLDTATLQKDGPPLKIRSAITTTQSTAGLIYVGHSSPDTLSVVAKLQATITPTTVQPGDTATITVNPTPSIAAGQTVAVDASTVTNVSFGGTTAPATLTGVNTFTVTVPSRPDGDVEAVASLAGGLPLSLGTVSFAPPPAPAPNPPTPALPPDDVAAVAADASASVSWSAPGSSGTYPVTSYLATSTPGGKTCLVSAPALECEVAGLTNGTPYTFAVKALTGAGWSDPSSPSNVVTPSRAPEPSILITGTRTQRLAAVSGTTTGFGMGAMLTPWIRLSGSGAFEQGKITVLVSMDGAFTWERRMRPGRPLSVYFTGGGVRSNTLTLR